MLFKLFKFRKGIENQLSFYKYITLYIMNEVIQIKQKKKSFADKSIH